MAWPLPQPNCAKRLECAELAPAFGRTAPFESVSKLVALQTLRALRTQSGMAIVMRVP